MTNLCIIPARGDSKRIPRKNIKKFLGKPIISYSIKSAIKSGLFDEVMVSTEDEEIAEIAIINGAEVPFSRSKENANDYATTFDVLEEVISKYENIGKLFDYTCCLYPTAPFVTDIKLINAYQSMMENNYNSIFPIVEFSFPIQRSLEIKSGKVDYVNPEEKNTRSQDLEKRYHDAGQFYFMKTSVIQRKQELVGNNAGTIIIPELEAQDIDSLTDWKLAELKYNLIFQ
jgi:N-acylneuraminate cytidylyltransferase